MKLHGFILLFLVWTLLWGFFFGGGGAGGGEKCIRVRVVVLHEFRIQDSISFKRKHKEW